MGALTDDLLTQIKLRSFAPISQTTFTDTNILDLAHEIARSYVQPMIMGMREDYFLTYADVSIQSGKKEYIVSERALGDSLKALWLYKSNGEAYRKLNRTDIDRRDYHEKDGDPTHFYMEGSDIVLVPTPNKSEHNLRQYYFRRLSEFVLSTSCAKISSVSDDGSLATFTVDTDLTDSLSAGDQVDFLNAQSPYRLWAEDVAIDSITSSTIVVALTSVQDGASNTLPGANDYITPRKKSCIPQLPEEWLTVLAQATVCTMLGSSLGDQKKYQLALNELSKLEKGAMKTIGQRVEDSPKKIHNRNGIFASIAGKY